MPSLRGDTKSLSQPLAVKAITVTGHTLHTNPYESTKNESKEVVEVVRDYFSVFCNTSRLSKFQSHLSRWQMSPSGIE